MDIINYTYNDKSQQSGKLCAFENLEPYPLVIHYLIATDTKGT